MSFIKPSKVIQETWGWDDQKKDWTDEDNVVCTNNQFSEKDKSMCFASIKKGEHHGWTTASSDYYYYIVSGSGKVKINDLPGEPIPIRQGDSFCIEAGTDYDYWADPENDLQFVLFMSKLWTEE